MKPIGIRETEYENQLLDNKNFTRNIHPLKYAKLKLDF